MTLSTPKTCARGVALIVSLILLGTLVVACGSDGTNTESSSGLGEAGEPIVIGASVGLSGIAAPYDSGPLAGARLYAKGVNEQGGIDGHRIEIKAADTHSQPSQGPTTVLDLENDGASAFLVTCDYDYGAPAAIAAEEDGHIVMSLCANETKWNQIGSLAFTTMLDTRLMGASAAQFAYDRGYRRAYVVTDNAFEVTREQCSYAQQSFEQLGGKIAGRLTFNQSDTTFTTQVSRLQADSDKYDTIIFCSVPPGGASFIKQLRAAGVDAPTIANDAMDGTYWVGSIPNLSDFFVTAVASIYGDDPSQAVNDFYSQLASEDPENVVNAYPLAGYSAMEAIVKAIEEAGTTDGTAASMALEKFRKTKLLIGPTSYAEEEHVPNDPRPVAVIEYTDGKPSFLENVTPSYVPPAEED